MARTQTRDGWNGKRGLHLSEVNVSLVVVEDQINAEINSISFSIGH